MAQGSTNKQYPTAIDTFTTWEDDIDNILALTVNDIADQLVAVQTELGTDPAGTLTNLKSRLAVSINNDGTLKTDTVDTDQLAADSVNETHIDLGNGANQVDHNTLGFQKKTVTVSAVNGEYAFDFTDEGLADYGSTAYQVFLCPADTNPNNVWAVVKDSTKATTGFTIKLRQPGLNGAADYNADAGAGGNVAVDIITIHQV